MPGTRAGGSFGAAALALASLVGLRRSGGPCWWRRGAGLAHGGDAPLVLGAVVAGVLVVVHLVLGEGGMDVKAVALLGLLSAVGAVLRPLSAGTAGVELVFTVLVLGGRVLGPGFGFALGSTTLLTSALLTGGVARGCPSRCWRPHGWGSAPVCSPGARAALRRWRCSPATVRSPLWRSVWR